MHIIIGIVILLAVIFIGLPLAFGALYLAYKWLFYIIGAALGLFALFCLLGARYSHKECLLSDEEYLERKKRELIEKKQKEAAKTGETLNEADIEFDGEDVLKSRGGEGTTLFMIILALGFSYAAYSAFEYQGEREIAMAQEEAVEKILEISQ